MPKNVRLLRFAQSAPFALFFRICHIYRYLQSSYRGQVRVISGASAMQVLCNTYLFAKNECTIIKILYNASRRVLPACSLCTLYIVTLYLISPLAPSRCKLSRRGGCIFVRYGGTSVPLYFVYCQFVHLLSPRCHLLCTRPGW